MISILFDVYSGLYDGFMKLFKLDNHQAIVGLVESMAGKRLRIADIGGGTGLLANTLIELGHEVVIIDPAKKMTEIAKKRNPEVIIINLAFESYPVSPRSYDVIILRDCLHHIQDQDLTLGKISQVLKDDGLLIIQEYAPASFSAKLIFTFERCCLEKVYPVAPAKLSEMMHRFNIPGTVISLNNRDYLAWGVKEK